MALLVARKLARDAFIVQAKAESPLGIRSIIPVANAVAELERAYMNQGFDSHARIARRPVFFVDDWPGVPGVTQDARPNVSSSPSTSESDSGTLTGRKTGAELMAEGTILITGGGGFLGVALAKALLQRDPSTSIVAVDIVKSRRLAAIAPKVTFIRADLSDAEVCDQLIAPEVKTVYHLASLVSGGAEHDFVGGYRANLHATLNLLESCRVRQTMPRYVFPSSIATFGGSQLPDTVDDWTFQHPQNSYGVAKVIGEQLLNDYSRKGYVDGRGVRLPAVVVRDEPNTAASGYASALVREPVAGTDYACPVPPDTRIPILSITRCVRMLVSLAEMPEGILGDYRTINGPSMAPSAEEIADAVRHLGMGGLGTITFDPDPLTEGIVAAWPKRMVFDRASALGLRPDDSIEAIVAEYRHQTGGTTP